MSKNQIAKLLLALGIGAVTAFSGAMIAGCNKSKGDDEGTKQEQPGDDDDDDDDDDDGGKTGDDDDDDDDDDDGIVTIKLSVYVDGATTAKEVEVATSADKTKIAGAIIDAIDEDGIMDETWIEIYTDSDCTKALSATPEVKAGDKLYVKVVKVAVTIKVTKGEEEYDVVVGVLKNSEVDLEDLCEVLGCEEEDIMSVTDEDDEAYMGGKITEATTIKVELVDNVNLLVNVEGLEDTVTIKVYRESAKNRIEMAIAGALEDEIDGIDSTWFKVYTDEEYKKELGDLPELEDGMELYVKMVKVGVTLHVVQGDNEYDLVIGWTKGEKLTLADIENQFTDEVESVTDAEDKAFTEATITAATTLTVTLKEDAGQQNPNEYDVTVHVHVDGAEDFTVKIEDVEEGETLGINDVLAAIVAEKSEYADYTIEAIYHWTNNAKGEAYTGDVSVNGALDIYVELTAPAASVETEDSTISVDFASVSSVTAGQAIGTTGFTAYGDGIAVNSQGGNQVLNFGGGVWSNSALARALGFNVAHAGKVEVTVEYSQGNAGRYLDLIDENGTVLATSVEEPTSASASDVKTYKLIAYTTSDDVKLYVGSHSSGIYIKSATVKNTWAKDGETSLVPEITVADVTIEKATTTYTLVNGEIEVSTSDVTSLGKTGGTTLEGYGYTVKNDLYKGENKQDEKKITVVDEESYSVKVTATLGESTITKDIALNVAYPTAIDVTVPASPEVEGASYSLKESDIIIKANDAAKTALATSVWTITYTVEADGSGSVSGEKPWTLTQGTYNVTVNATRAGVTTPLTKTVSLTVKGESKDVSTPSLTTWGSSFTDNKVVLQNAAKGTITAGSVFTVKIKTSSLFSAKTTVLENDSATDHVQVSAGDALDFTLAQGYNYTIKIATGSSGASGRKMTLNGVEKTTGANSDGTVLTWTISNTDIDAATKTFTLAISGGAARIGSIVIEAVYVGD